MVSREMISFPIDVFKAETIRAMAADLGIAPRGKKDEVLIRMRELAEAGWKDIPESPVKRKSSPTQGDETPAKRARTIPKKELRDLGETNDSPRQTRQSRSSLSAPRRPPPKARANGSVRKKTKAASKDEDDNEEKDVDQGDIDMADDAAEPTKAADEDTAHIDTLEESVKDGPITLYLPSTEADALINNPTSKRISFWKPTSSFVQRDIPSAQRVQHWILRVEEGVIANHNAFKTAYAGIIEQANSKVADEVLQGIQSDLVWYAISVGRDVGDNAIGVKMVKGGVQDGNVVPLEDVEENGVFGLTDLTLASKKDNAELNHIHDGFA
ncbi:hypothetical protein M422DRAFT_34379 [Sphaerobolus stellatus SS14]|uniref:SAP domain-containing protein n=1 Tax=Sphaerobolus stellatus (strain SS14) TaxID=990650 RepID=A0A0C9VF83_SPHS4|nr:hypothetical protein M422DRAFT_34379 [Sphaerobolus stellatus SS14]